MNLSPAYRVMGELNRRVESYKARPGQPLRNEKATTEAALERLFKRQFARMQARVIEWAGTQKAILDIPEWLLEWEDEFEEELLKVYTRAMLASGFEWFQTVSLRFDTSGYNVRAYKAAAEVVGDLIKGIDQTTKDLVRQAVQTFIETPGFTISDLSNMLPFNPIRANSIAVTETTRAFAEGERQAGIELHQRYPDVPVLKTWMTNEDEKVCPICGGLDGQEVDINEPFIFEGEEFDQPPAHPNCRCWMQARTRINE